VRKLLLICAISLAFTSCRRGDPSWETGIGVPVAHGSFGIEQLIADSLTATGLDGTVYIDHTFALNNLGTDTLFNIPDTTLRYAYSLPIPYQLAPGTQLVNQTSTTRYQLGAIQLMNSILRSGKMVIFVQNDLTQPVDVRLRLPNATRNNLPLDTLLHIAAAPDSIHGFQTSAEVDLSGYTVDLRGPQYNQVNTLTTQYTANISTNATGFENLYPADSVVMNLTFTGIVPEYVRGYFGNQTLQAGPEETATGIFDLITSGSFGLDSLKMELELENYVGMDARMRINGLWARNSATGQIIYMNAPVIGQTYNFNRATYSYGNPPSVPSRFSMQLDNSNSNLRAMVESMPDYLGYNIHIETNPLGNVSGSNDFFYHDWGLNAKMHLLMPLSFHASQLTLADTLDVDMTPVENPEAVGGGTLTVFAQNSFPFHASIQLYLLDAAGNITDVLVAQPNVIAQAPLVANSSNSVVSNGSTPGILHIPLTAAQSQRLLHSNRVYAKAVFDTGTAPNYVRIRNTDKLDLRITADFNYTFGN
jgi:hypothetical protein